MPRFHFHLHHQDEAIYDYEGMNFSNLKQAEDEARKSIRELAADDFRNAMPFTVISICITDTDGNPVSIILSHEVVASVIPRKIAAFSVRNKPTTALH